MNITLKHLTNKQTNTNKLKNINKQKNAIKTNNTIKNKFYHNEKGFIFSMDLIIACIIILFSILWFVIFINNNLTLTINFETEKYLEAKTIFIVDSFIKNFNEENTLLGSCKFDESKKRILSNELNSNYFSNIKKIDINNFFIKKIETKNNFDSKIIYFEEQNSKNCISIKRFILLDNIKNIIIFTGCLVE